MADGTSDLISLCAARLALTRGEVMTIARTAPKRYFVWSIPKRSGKGHRIVCHPSRELKPLQDFFLNEILSTLPVHPSAMAYVKHRSIKLNAEAHVNSRVVLKLDFTDFFNSLTAIDWLKFAKDHYPAWSDAEIAFSSQVLFWGRGSYKPQCLAIGASSSPLLSNALVYDIDVKLHKYAKQKKIVYTRYADDITFSSKGFVDQKLIVKYVKSVLRQARYTNIALNEDKTVLASKKSSRIVTGLRLTPSNKVSLGRERKRVVSAMVHHASVGKISTENRAVLAGLLAFSNNVEPIFVAKLRKKYSTELIERIMKGRWDLTQTSA